MKICFDKVWVKKIAHIQKLAINKSSTIFAQSLWYLVKIVTSWVNHFDKVSWRLGKNHGIFTNSQFLVVCSFFYPDFIYLQCTVLYSINLTMAKNTRTIWNYLYLVWFLLYLCENSICYATRYIAGRQLLPCFSY